MARVYKESDQFAAERELLKTKKASDTVIRKQFVCDEIKGIDEGKRIIDFVISTGSVDRYRDKINTEGWDLKAYKKNPVVLFCHDSWSPPIAKAIPSSVVIDGKKLRASAQFVPAEIDPFAELIFQLYLNGFMKATSVGFRPLDYEYIYDEDSNRYGGVDFKEQELLEFSCVPVPANSEALVAAKSFGLDTDPLVKWCAKQIEADKDHINPVFGRKALERLWRVSKGASPTVVALKSGLIVPAGTKTPEESEKMAEKDALVVSYPDAEGKLLAQTFKAANFVVVSDSRASLCELEAALATKAPVMIDEPNVVIFNKKTGEYAVKKGEDLDDDAMKEAIQVVLKEKDDTDFVGGISKFSIKSDNDLYYALDETFGLEVEEVAEETDITKAVEETLVVAKETKPAATLGTLVIEVDATAIKEAVEEVKQLEDATKKLEDATKKPKVMTPEEQIIMFDQASMKFIEAGEALLDVKDLKGTLEIKSQKNVRLLRNVVETAKSILDTLDIPETPGITSNEVTESVLFIAEDDEELEEFVSAEEAKQILEGVFQARDKIVADSVKQAFNKLTGRLD